MEKGCSTFPHADDILCIIDWQQFVVAPQAGLALHDFIDPPTAAESLQIVPGTDNLLTALRATHDRLIVRASPITVGTLKFDALLPNHSPNFRLEINPLDDSVKHHIRL